MSTFQSSLTEVSPVGIILKGVALALAVLATLHVLKGRSAQINLPPSPPAFASFLLGHIAAMPRELQWQAYGSWAKTLGKFLTLTNACALRR